MRFFSSVLRRALFVIALTICIVGSPAARADDAGGRIVFASNRDGNYELYIMDADGANETRLTYDPDTDMYPCLSPDGRKVAWAKWGDDFRPAIYEMNVDRSETRRISSTDEQALQPVYSPDGTSIAYSGRKLMTNQNICIVDLRNFTYRRVTDDRYGDQYPSWNPAGTRIVYEAGFGDGTPQLATINADGTGLQNVADSFNYSPRWSSTGRIAFRSSRDGKNEVYSMQDDGADQQRLTTEGNNEDPAWNPAGGKLTFRSNRDVDTNGTHEIYSMNADGSGQTRLTYNQSEDLQPFWGRAAAVNERFGNLTIGDVEVIEPDSGEVAVQLTVQLSAPAQVPVMVNYYTAEGTAASPDDYPVSNGTVFFAVGESQKTIAVPVKGDTSVEGDEYFRVILTNSFGADIGDNVAFVNIVDNDSFPLLSIDTVSVAEGNSGTALATLNVSLSTATARTVTVDYATVDGTASAGADYTAASGSLTFAPGETVKQISVEIRGDIRYEKDEAFSVALSNAMYARLPPPAGAAQVYNPANGHWYQLMTTNTSWNAAKPAAEGMTLYGVPGHLATITSLQEKDFLAGLYPTYRYHLGGYQPAGSTEPAGGWRWVTGEPFGYTFWKAGEPNNSGGNEDIIVTFASPSHEAGRWNDASRSFAIPYMVEYDTPVSAGLDQRPGTVIISNDDVGPLPPAELTIDSPQPNRPTFAVFPPTGTSTDYPGGGGIVRVYFNLKRLGDNRYWTGSSWNAVEPVDITASLSPNGIWKYIGSLPQAQAPSADQKLTEGQYLLTAFAVNADGISLSAECRFTIDTTLPSVAVTSPADGWIAR